MADVVFIAVVVAFMALAWLLVRACDRLLGPDDPGLTAGPPTTTATPAPLYEPAPGVDEALPAEGPR